MIEDVVKRFKGVVKPKTMVIDSYISGKIPVINRMVQSASQNIRGINSIFPRKYCLNVIMKKDAARIATMTP
jgi:hypothetical protein